MTTCWPKHLDCLHREYIGRAVTLHGEPAKIVNGPDGYAQVTPLDSDHGPIDYSWIGVMNICDNHNGRFPWR